MNGFDYDNYASHSIIELKLPFTSIQAFRSLSSVDKFKLVAFRKNKGFMATEETVIDKISLKEILNEMVQMYFDLWESEHRNRASDNMARN